MQPFTYVALPFRVVFGAGRVASLGDELDALGAERALFCVSPGRTGEVERVSRAIEDRCVGIAANALPFTPIECVREALDHARDLAADCVVSYGGGNAIGLAKVLADARALVAEYSTAPVAKRERRLINNNITVHVQQIAATRSLRVVKIGSRNTTCETPWLR